MQKENIPDKVAALRCFFDEFSPNYDPNRLLKPEEASAILCVTQGTLSVWRSSGRYDLKYVKCGRLVRYRVSDLKEFIAQRTLHQTEARHGK